MLLLTSSQVSVALSSVVVVVFTAALFFSGYAIQQRTLRDLRAAIRAPPRPSPRTFLPDRFRHATTELGDGSVVVLGGGAEEEGGQETIVEVEPSRAGEERIVAGGSDRGGDRRIRPGTERGARNGQKSMQDGTLAPKKDEKPVSRAERRRLIKEEIKRLSQGDQPVLYQRRVY